MLSKSINTIRISPIKNYTINSVAPDYLIGMPVVSRSGFVEENAVEVFNH
jgi:hypothetical protein